jgi:hypothetical protein
MEKKKYGKLMGGFAWPHGNKPGYAVLLAADDEPDKELKAHHLWVLEEREERTVSELARYCVGLDEQYREQGLQIERWNTGTIENGMIEYAYKDMGDKVFNLVPTELPEEDIKMGVYVQAIQQVTEVKPILHFGENSYLLGYLQNFPKDYATRKPSEFPPLAALGYAVRELQRWSKEEVKRKRTAAERIFAQVEAVEGDEDYHFHDDEDNDGEGGGLLGY